jgi:putative FmdB family regulatory protein
MPVYVYHCDKCLRHFEYFQHFTDDTLTVCPDCETPTLRKLFEPTPVHYKGEGFYSTDKGVPEKAG